MITLEGIFSPDNLNLALRKVKDNKGAPGIDGLKVEDFPKWFYDHPFELTNAIMDGTYKPKPIKRVYIPKELSGNNVQNSRKLNAEVTLCAPLFFF